MENHLSVNNICLHLNSTWYGKLAINVIKKNKDIMQKLMVSQHFLL